MCPTCRCYDCECEHVAGLDIHALELEILWLRVRMPADRGFDTRAERGHYLARIDNRIDAWKLRKDLTKWLAEQ